MRTTALVTGASSGLGLEFARICAADDIDVVAVARGEGKLYALKDELEEAHPGITVYVCPADLSREDAALDVFDFLVQHRLEANILINCAGFGDSGDYARADWRRQRDMVQVNIVALMQLTHLVLKPMVARGQGMVLNISSVAAFSAGPGMSVYYASKAFVMSFSEALAEEFRGTGITVTALCPGPTATGFESAASMSSGSTMFRHAASAPEVAREGYAAMRSGKVLDYVGVFTKAASLGARLLPRSVSRKFAAFMNR